MAEQKNIRGNASQYFVAGELCRRGYSAAITIGNTPNVDILCSNLDGSKFVSIQVKTFRPGDKTCSVGKKAEIFIDEKFFWVLAGIPPEHSEMDFEYYIIPSIVMAENVCKQHQTWLNNPGKSGQVHNDSRVRTILLSSTNSLCYWDISLYHNRWDLIEEKLKINY